MPSPVSFAGKPTLTGERVLLRPVEVADAAGLFAVDAETLRLTGSHLTASLAELERWYGSRAGHDDRIDLSIIDLATGEWAGEVVLNELNPANRSCGFRILLGSARFRGRGLGTEASRLILAHAFEAGVHRVELEVYDFNPRARHVYDKVGFVFEGTKRHALCWDGQWVDAHLMSILSEEWAVHHGHPAPPPVKPRG